MQLASLGHDDAFADRRALAVNNVGADWLVPWSDVDAAWYQCLPCRQAEYKEAMGRTMLTFARAYLVALESAQQDPRFDKRHLPPGDHRQETCKDISLILKEIRDSANTRGEVTMGSIVRSFQWCPGMVLCQTLTLLTWAGHVGSFSTLATYKSCFQKVVDAYWSSGQLFFRDRYALVCYFCMYGIVLSGMSEYQRTADYMTFL